MDKYYKVDEVEKLLSCGCAYAIRELPTVEVSEDAIDRYAALAELDPRSYEYKAVKELPSVVPKAKEGEWIGYEVPSECSVCGHHWDEYISGQDIWHDGSVPNYCPNCGAKMKGAE